MTRVTSLIFLAACCTFMSACSVLTRMQYYAPSHESSIPEDRTYLEGFRLSGPPINQGINIESAELVTSVSGGVLIDGEKTYWFGPPWLPIIPTLFNWFIPYKKIGPDIEIAFTFRTIKKDIQWDPHKSFVVVTGGSSIFASEIKGQDRRVIDPGELIKIKKSWSSWGVTSQFSLPKNTNEFTLFIRGLSSDGKEIPDIPVTFKYSKSWVMGFIP